MFVYFRFHSCFTLYVLPTNFMFNSLYVSGTSLLGSFMLLLILVTQISPPSEVIKFVTYICCNICMVAAAVMYSVGMVNLCNRNTPVPIRTRRVSIVKVGEDWDGIIALRGDVGSMISVTMYSHKYIVIDPAAMVNLCSGNTPVPRRTRRGSIGRMIKMERGGVERNNGK